MDRCARVLSRRQASFAYVTPLMHEKAHDISMQRIKKEAEAAPPRLFVCKELKNLRPGRDGADRGCLLNLVLICLFN